MGYELKKEQMNEVLKELAKEYLIYAPKCFEDGGRFSDTDCIRYGQIETIEEIVLDKKAQYSFKEVLLPISQTLFYFTEDEIKEASAPQKGAIVFLRSCDLHGVKRLDEMYLNNGAKDVYYSRIREKVKFVLIGCSHAFDSCFCVDMGTNISNNYAFSIDASEKGYQLDCKEKELEEIIKKYAEIEKEVIPAFVTETTTTVTIPSNLSYQIAKADLWREYDQRCINCGRCNFVCPTCTCFTMQDVFYSENGKAGERRRVWASCMVDGYTNVAGGGNYRQKSGDRMRFKVLHKVLDFKERSGYHMCVGCGRCDDICPEYISFSNCINKLEDGMKEVLGHE